MTNPDSTSGAAPGFAGAGAALGAITGSTDQLQQQVSSGQLRMNPDAAHNAATVYEDKADKVERLAQRARQLDKVTGLGDYPSAQQLAKKFGRKAANGSTGAADLLTQFADELRRKADLFRQAAKDYVANDEQIGHDMQEGQQ